MSKKIQIIPYPNKGGLEPDGINPRVETGAVQFGNDWPGLFIRGDDAFSLFLKIKILREFIQNLPEKTIEIELALDELMGLYNTIQKDVIIN